jgi:hypothetical protein
VTAYTKLVTVVVDRFSFCLTLVNLLNAISAWLRDMTGLSNQALSAAPNKPLRTLFEARPILIEDLLGFKLMTRSAGLMSAFKARRVMLTNILLVRCCRNLAEHEEK